MRRMARLISLAAARRRLQAIARIRRLLRSALTWLGRRSPVGLPGARPRQAPESSTATVDLARLRLHVGTRKIPFTPADILNPEAFHPTAEAVVVLQAERLRGIIFGRRRNLDLAAVLRLAARAGKLRPVGRGLRSPAEIWVDPLGGIYDLTNLELVRMPAVEFLGPVPCACTRGVA